MKVVIGTKNEGKIEGAKRALEHYFENVEIIGIGVKSNVPDQPVNEQIYQGVSNRLKNLKRYCKENTIDADFYLAIESGITEQLGNWIIINIAMIQTKEGFQSYGTSCGFPVPTQYVKEIIEKDLNIVMNKVFGEDKQRHNQKGGIELLTKGIVNRIDQTEQAFIMAFTQYLNENWK